MTTPRVNQCQKPTGWFGRFTLRNMNSRHSKVTDWGLSHISIPTQGSILDVGCGGGRTVSKLAAIAILGKVCGIDHSKDSVAVAGKTNREWIEMGRVQIHESSVSQLPFSQGVFDLVTAIETHFWWPDLSAGMREVFRVTKPGGTLIVIAEVYKGADTRMARICEKYAPRTGMTLLTVDEHRELLAHAGFSDVQVVADAGHGWICATGRKPS